MFHFLIFGAGITIACPASNASYCLLHQNFHAICLSVNRKEVIGQILVHYKLCALTIVETVAHSFEIPFDGKVDARFHIGPVYATGGLPPGCGGDIVIAELPGIHRRHGRCIGYEVYILPHRVESGFYRKIVQDGVSPRQAEFRADVESRRR